MTLASFEAALERTDELELTTTGRATGKPVSCPVWFVRRGEKLYLVPGDETDSQWYKNLLKTPAVRLAARGAQPVLTVRVPSGFGIRRYGRRMPGRLRARVATLAVTRAGGSRCGQGRLDRGG